MKNSSHKNTSARQTQELLNTKQGIKRNHLHTLVGIQSLGEVVDGRRDLQALLQDGALTLQTHVTRPLDKAGQVAHRRQVAADAVIALLRVEEVGVLLVEGQLDLLLARRLLGRCGLALGGGGNGCGLISLGLENDEKKRDRETRTEQNEDSAGESGLNENVAGKRKCRATSSYGTKNTEKNGEF